MPIRACPESLPPELSELVQRFGQVWASSPDRPKPTHSATEGWRELLDQWIDSELPLLVRKHKGDRGTEHRHISGRVLVPTDNSPAHWSFTLACSGVVPTIHEIRDWMASDAVPVAMIQKVSEKAQAQYHCCLPTAFDVNKQGWKLGHIEAVGLKSRAPIQTLPLDRLYQQHRDLLSPANMFVIPLAWSGLAEVDAIIQAMASQQ